MQDLLSQEEINALLNGLEDGPVADDSAEPELSEVVPCVPGEMDQLQRSSLPGLELLCQRLARQLQVELYKWLGASAQVSCSGFGETRFDEFCETVNEPASLSLVQLSPLHGSSILALDSKLVFKLVEQFFGGGSGHARIESRCFSGLEMRVIKRFLEQAIASLAYAWQALLPVSPELMATENSTEAIPAMAPEESLLVCSFDIVFSGSGGVMQWVAPYSMLEPLREKLAAGLASDSDTAPGHWQQQLTRGVRATKLAMHYVVESPQLSLRQLLELQAGDIVPIDENSGIICANSRQLFKAQIREFSEGLSVDLQGRVDQ